MLLLQRSHVITRSSVKMEQRRGAALLAESSPSASRDSALLLCRSLGKDRAWLLAHPDVTLTEPQLIHFNELLARRAKHEPMQYILGEQEFYGLSFLVTPEVLIPRPETEHLVEAALACLPLDQAARVADVGTGSGAIAVALADARPALQVTALDLSPPALHIAKLNAERHGLSAHIYFLESDLLASVANQRFDMIVANLPYVAAEEVLEEQVRRWEPALALYAGPRGTELYERLIPQASRALLPGGWLLLEIGHGQHEEIQSLLAGWREIRFIADLQGIPRVAIACRQA